MPTAPQEVRTFFVTAVTWGRRPIFRADALARLFLEVLQHYRGQQAYLLHEFVLMPEHFHVLLTPAPNISLEKAVQFIKGGFSFRVKHDMASNLEIWQRHPTNHRIHDAVDYTRHAEYIRENPVKRGLVAKAEEYPYSSASRALEVDPAPPGLKAQVLGAFGSFVGLKPDASTGCRPDVRKDYEHVISLQKMYKLQALAFRPANQGFFRAGLQPRWVRARAKARDRVSL